MKRKVKKNKLKGYIKSPRKKLDWYIKYKFTDQEMVLFEVLLVLADWDRRRKDTFGTIDCPIRKIKEWYLPHWSIGKISMYINNLIEKGVINKIDDGRLKIINYVIYRRSIKDVQHIEDPVHLDKQKVHFFEQDVRDLEQNDFLKDLENEQDQDQSVQAPEHKDSSKESLEKVKDNLNNNKINSYRGGKPGHISEVLSKKIPYFRKGARDQINGNPRRLNPNKVVLKEG